MSPRIHHQTAGNSLPAHINAALYVAAMATAWVRLQAKITRLDDTDLAGSLKTVLAFSWLDDVTRQPIATWHEELRANL